MSMQKKALKQPTYVDGRVKQSFKDETDINKILKRAQATGTISHLNKYQAQYTDYADFDFFDNQLKLTRGREIFDALPSELRSEFNQSQAQFFAYVNDPENKDRLGKLLPALAEPGRQNLNVAQRAAKAAGSEPTASETSDEVPEADKSAAPLEASPAAPTPPPAKLEGESSSST